MINVKILTGYPEMFPGGLAHSLMGKALKENIFKIETINLHEFGIDNRKSVDDEPFGRRSRDDFKTRCGRKSSFVSLK